MHCIALRHLTFEDLGVLAPVLHEQGASIEYWNGGRCAYDDRAWMEADLAVVLGGPIGVGDEDRYPFLRDELRLVKARLEAGLPLLGVCLGAQLMAAAALQPRFTRSYFSAPTFWPVKLAAALFMPKMGMVA